VRGRVLNTVNQGFAVAVGTRVGFMPLSHACPAAAARSLDFNIEDIILGRELWLMVLAVDGVADAQGNINQPLKEKNRKYNLGEKGLNFVVSHRKIPAIVFLLPEFRRGLRNENKRWGNHRQKQAVRPNFLQNFASSLKSKKKSEK